MPKINHFEELNCWQEARKLTRMIYELTNYPNFKKDLRLSGQVQSAAGSVMANIAEGFIRRSNKEFIQFLFIAISSAAEVQSHLYIAFDQNYITKDQFEKIYIQTEKTSKLISGFIKYLRENEKQWKQKKQEKLKKPKKL